MRAVEKPFGRLRKLRGDFVAVEKRLRAVEKPLGAVEKPFGR